MTGSRRFGVDGGGDAADVGDADRRQSLLGHGYGGHGHGYGHGGYGHGHTEEPYAGHGDEPHDASPDDDGRRLREVKEEESLVTLVLNQPQK